MNFKFTFDFWLPIHTSYSRNLKSRKIFLFLRVFTLSISWFGDLYKQKYHFLAVVKNARQNSKQWFVLEKLGPRIFNKIVCFWSPTAGEWISDASECWTWMQKAIYIFTRRRCSARTKLSNDWEMGRTVWQSRRN